MSEPNINYNFEERLENRIAGRKLAIDAAIEGEGISGAYFALLCLDPLTRQIDEFLDYEDFEPDEDDIRPF